MASKNWEPYVGKKFGRLTVKAYEKRSKLDATRKSGRRGATFFICSCSCGKETMIESCYWEKTQSCGCFRGENIKNIHIPKPLEPLFIHGVPVAEYLAKWRAEQALARAEKDCRTAFCHQVSRSSYL